MKNGELMKIYIENITIEKNKLKELKEDLMIVNRKINSITNENNKIKNSEENLLNDIVKLKKKKDKIVKYRKKIGILRFECILCLILCLILVSLLGPYAAHLFEITNLQSLFVLWLTFFIPFYPITLSIFYGTFNKYFATKRYLKNNNLSKVERLIIKKSRNQKLSKQQYLLNNKRIEHLKEEQNRIKNDLEKTLMNFSNCDINEELIKNYIDIIDLSNVDNVENQEFVPLQKVKK